MLGALNSVFLIMPADDAPAAFAKSSTIAAQPLPAKPSRSTSTDASGLIVTVISFAMSSSLCLQVFYDPFSINDRVRLQFETLAASLFVHAGRSITPLQTCHVLVIVLPFVKVTDDRGILPVLIFDKANVF